MSGPGILQPAAGSSPASAPELLFEDPHIRIDRYAAGSSTVVLTFDPLQYLWPQPPFGLDFLRAQCVDVIAVQRKDENFYQALSRERFHHAVAPRLAPYTRVVAYGSSLGAYAALYFGRDLDCEVISASPRVSVHPVFGSRHWQDQMGFTHERFGTACTPRCRATILYDPREPTDRRYIEGEVLPQFSSARLLRVPFAGHPSTQFLGDIGFIAPFVRAVVAGSEPPDLDRRRRRRDSATYYQVLSELCASRGRLAAANTLIERSLALRDHNMLAQRTRGRVKTLLGDWPAAVSSLELALRIAPQDALTASMLAQARQGLASASLRRAAAPPQGVEAAPEAAPDTVPQKESLARRALRWLDGGR